MLSRLGHKIVPPPKWFFSTVPSLTNDKKDSETPLGNSDIAVKSVSSSTPPSPRSPSQAQGHGPSEPVRKTWVGGLVGICCFAHTENLLRSISNNLTRLDKV